MKTVLITAALFGGFCADGWAQTTFYGPGDSFVDFKVFPNAAVVLTTGTILNGSLELFRQPEVIAVKCANDSAYTLPARLVRGFAVKDAATEQRAGDTYVALQRVFRTFPLPLTGGKPASGWGFYEQLSQGVGPVLLLRREQQVACDGVVVGQRPGSTDATPVPVKVYPCPPKSILYLRTAEGAIVALNKPKDILRYLPQQAPQLRAYAQQNDLRYDNVRELSFLVNYANTLPAATP